LGIKSLQNELFTKQDTRFSQLTKSFFTKAASHLLLVIKVNYS